jgi:hypothetical protein
MIMPARALTQKKLPIGIQTFRKIIEEDCVYADKTEYLYRLLAQGGAYFLSRPRRFGKSLLLDTLAELLQGQRQLFQGFWIDASDYDFKRYPVVRLDMSLVDSNADILERSIMNRLAEIAQAESLDISGDSPMDVLIRLLNALNAKYGEKVVVLVDEYDKPILDHIGDAVAAEANRAVLSSFYGVMKGMDRVLRFVFITGVTKFTKTSIFSGLNNLRDITLHPDYANICGLTDKDVDALFRDRMEDAGNFPEILRKWYDGYSWDGKTHVYNPFSLLNFFDSKQLADYWYESGSPKFLIELLRKKPQNFFEVENVVVDQNILNRFDISDIPLIPLLFQTGYLTIRSVETKDYARLYTLGFPNLEVRQAFSRQTAEALTYASETSAYSAWLKMRTALENGSPEELGDVLAGLFASIPYQLHIPEEAYYHSLFLAVMIQLGFSFQGETSVAGGRADGILEMSNGRVYVMEMKYKKCRPDAGEKEKQSLLDGAIQDAMAQILDRGYADPFKGSGKTIFRVAVAVAGRSDVRVRAEMA